MIPALLLALCLFDSIYQIRRMVLWATQRDKPEARQFYPLYTAITALLWASFYFLTH